MALVDHTIDTDEKLATYQDGLRREIAGYQARLDGETDPADAKIWAQHVAWVSAELQRVGGDDDEPAAPKRRRKTTDVVVDAGDVSGEE